MNREAVQGGWFLIRKQTKVEFLKNSKEIGDGKFCMNVPMINGIYFNENCDQCFQFGLRESEYEPYENTYVLLSTYDMDEMVMSDDFASYQMELIDNDILMVRGEDFIDYYIKLSKDNQELYDYLTKEFGN